MCTPDSENSSPEHGDLTSQLVGKQKLRLGGWGAQIAKAWPGCHSMCPKPHGRPCHPEVCCKDALSGSAGLGFCHSPHLPREHTRLSLWGLED